MKKDWQKQLSRIQKQNTAVIIALGISTAVLGMLLFPDLWNSLSLLELYAVIFAAFLLSAWLQTMLHEAGHLVFGLLSGYEFGYYCIGSHAWMKQDGRLVRRRVYLPGTAGSCLMIAPDVRPMPHALFYMGGAIVDLLAAALCFSLCLPLRFEFPYPACYLMVHGVYALYSALNNAIPRRTLVFNDGSRVRALRDNPEAQASCALQQRITHALLCKNLRLRDMPDAWFSLPDASLWNNGITASQAVLYYDRLQDQHRFNEARILAERLLESAALPPGSMLMLTADLICYELMNEYRPEVISDLLDKTQKKYMKSMGKSFTMLRARCICALLGQDSTENPEDLRRQLERLARRSPSDACWRIDLEMMNMARDIYWQRITDKFSGEEHDPQGNAE